MWSASPARLLVFSQLETPDERSRAVAAPGPARVGKLNPITLQERYREMIGRREINWTIVAMPNSAWAEQVFGKPDVDPLWRAIEKAVRLDSADPVAEWNAHIERLDAIATALAERHFDAIHYRGPGTDLTVGLLPGSHGVGANF